MGGFWKRFRLAERFRSDLPISQKLWGDLEDVSLTFSWLGQVQALKREIPGNTKEVTTCHLVEEPTMKWTCDLD